MHCPTDGRAVEAKVIAFLQLNEMSVVSPMTFPLTYASTIPSYLSCTHVFRTQVFAPSADELSSGASLDPDCTGPQLHDTSETRLDFKLSLCLIIRLTMET
jgi:hypothetical protein